MTEIRIATRYCKNDTNRVVNPVKQLLAAEGISQMLEGIFFRIGWVEKYYDPEFIKAFTYSKLNSYRPTKEGCYNYHTECLVWLKNLPLWAQIKIVQDSVSMMDENFDLPSGGEFNLSSRGEYIAEIIDYINSSHALGYVVDNLVH